MHQKYGTLKIINQLIKSFNKYLIRDYKKINTTISSIELVSESLSSVNPSA